MKIVPMKVELVDKMGSDLSVVNAARVSFAKESDWEHTDSWDGTWGLSEKDKKLIKYLANHGHWTPFAHAFLSFRIKAPIFVARQLVKHQVGLCWNEVSRRYVSDEPEFFWPDVYRGKPVNAKQGSTGTVEIPDKEYLKALDTIIANYEESIDLGWAPEQARMMLPQNMMTEWIWSGSLAAFARVCKLRLDPHAQLETQEIAKQINALVPKEFEHSWNALIDNNNK